MNSQVEVTKILRALVKDMQVPQSIDGLIKLRDLMFSKLEFRPYDESTKEHEAEIRWKRTAAQILDDGFVYRGKACTDLVVLFIALCKTLGLEARFVKVKSSTKIHSLAEVKLDDVWYIFDVSFPTGIPVKGELTEATPYLGWKLWKKGRDAWDIGLTKSDDEVLMKN